VGVGLVFFRQGGLIVHFLQIDFDGVAQGVQGQVVGRGAEGVFQLFRQGFQGQEGVGNEHGHQGSHIAQVLYQGEGQQGAEEVDGTVQDQAVGKGNGGGGDAFAAPQDVGKLVQIAIHARIEHVAQGSLLALFSQPAAQGQEDAVGG